MITNTDSPEALRLRLRLADELAAAGSLPDGWRSSLISVPRHVFVPAFHTHGPRGPEQVSREDSCWLESVYRDDALATQFVDGIATSSSTAPGLMLRMLSALGVREGQRVLEIGTGTGYNAALLCDRLGDGQVVTVDVDPEITAAASERLASIGYRPTVLTADGRAGALEHGPFDGIIATAAFDDVPVPWLEQLAEGGVLVVPIGNGIARLVRGRGVVEGTFLADLAYFMHVRDVRQTGQPVYPATPHAGRRFGDTATDAGVLDDWAFRFALSLVETNLACAVERDGEGRVAAAEMWSVDGSWARVEEGRCEESGPRDLWGRVGVLYRTWVGEGRPTHGQVGITATPMGQRMWLYSPDGPAWPPAA